LGRGRLGRERGGKAKYILPAKKLLYFIIRAQSYENATAAN